MVVVIARVAEDLGTGVVHVDDSHFLNPAARVGRDLDIAILLQGCVRQLDDRKHVRRQRVRVAVEVCSRPEDSDAEFPLRVIVQHDRSLHRENRAIAQQVGSGDQRRRSVSL